MVKGTEKQDAPFYTEMDGLFHWDGAFLGSKGLSVGV